jgi:DNA primase
VSFTPDFLDEIRTRVRLSDVVARKVKLVRAGQEFKGRCPFHNEKTPSFYVNDAKEFYHCFGCGAHGDVIRFICEAEGRGFVEAVEELAGQAGLELPQSTPEDQARSARLGDLRAIMAAAQLWFAEQLQGLEGSQARSYLVERGLQPQTIRQFGIGYAPDRRDGIKAALMSQGASEADLIEAGLLIALEDGSKTPYDRFRNRLMFPIRDSRGQVIAFGGRALGDGQPKYLNSPDTPLFDKGRTLYNLDQAAGPGRKQDQIIVAEGYLDVIALAEAGLPNAVAPLGTALTEEQMDLLWRVAPEPMLCFDGDNAGQRAATRAAQRALPRLRPGFSLRFALLPTGEDPDTLVRSRGVGAFEQILAVAEPLADLLWRSELSASDVTTPERRAAFKARLRDLVRTIGNPDVRGLYGAEFAGRLETLFGSASLSAPGKGFVPRKQLALPASRALRATRERLGNFHGNAAFGRQVLRVALIHPNLVDKHLESFAILPLDDAEQAALRDSMIAETTRGLALDFVAFRNNLSTNGFERLIGDLETPDKRDYSFASTSASLTEAEHGMTLVMESLTQIAQLEADLDNATRVMMDDPTEEAATRQRTVKQELDRMRAGLKQLALDDMANSPQRPSPSDQRPQERRQEP